jgi:predicted nuclease of predicted toxin-antitoxin system
MTIYKDSDFWEVCGAVASSDAKLWIECVNSSGDKILLSTQELEQLFQASFIPF